MKKLFFYRLNVGLKVIYTFANLGLFLQFKHLHLIFFAALTGHVMLIHSFFFFNNVKKREKVYNIFQP
jgi:hypothetical protein